MKEILFTIGVLAVLSSCSVSRRVQNENAQPVTLKVMSYNIRYDNPNDGENLWDIRKPATKELIYDLRPHIFGVQEALLNQIRYIEENCPEYVSVGVGRDDGKEAGEFMSIFYDKERVKLHNWGSVWLSETPEKPGLGWDAWCPRTATWAIVELIGTGRKLFYVNTHLDHGGRNARKNSLDLIMKLIEEENVENVPVILTGDFNVTPDNTFTLVNINSYMNNAATTALVADAAPTSNTFGKREGKCIDYIWWKNFKACNEYHVITKEYSGIKYISDHWPIVAELVF